MQTGHVTQNITHVWVIYHASSSILSVNQHMKFEVYSLAFSKDMIGG